LLRFVCRPLTMMAFRRASFRCLVRAVLFAIKKYGELYAGADKVVA
jgi:hypothetical protein